MQGAGVPRDNGARQERRHGNKVEEFDRGGPPVTAPAGDPRRADCRGAPGAAVRPLSNAVVCVSEAVRSRASSLTFFRGKLGLIYNGFRLVDRQRSTFRSEIGIPDDALVIGNIGNLYPVKGQRFLIDAFARFLELFPEAYLVLVGRGGEKDNLMAQVKHLPIPDGRVIFTGFRNDIGNILNALDLFVLPSLSEGLPVSLLEALTAEVPVIATRVGGVAEVLGNSEHGMLVPPASADRLLAVALARRDRPSREGKSFVSKTDLASTVTALVDEIQASLLQRATEDRDANIHDVRTYDELKEAVQDGWAFVYWCESRECEARVKEETRATTRNIPFNQPNEEGTCVVCGGSSKRKVYFAKAY